MLLTAEDAGGAKVLVLDDTHTVASLLAAADREVVQVGSGAEALRVLATHDFAACVLSSHLDGIATATSITTNERIRSVPIVLLTAGPQDAASAEQAYASGVVDVIPRSLDGAVLRAKISVFVNHHRLRARDVARREAEYVGSQGQFLATLGEELRPPLNTMLGWIRMLRDGSIREAQRVRALETIERSALAQLELIEDMLDVSRMTSKTLTLDLVVVDLRRIVEAVVEAHRPAAIDKQVTLFAAVDDDVAPMSADPERLRQVAHRLVKHAVASTPTEGVVTVSLRNTGSNVELAITNTAEGTEALLARPIFDGSAIVGHLVELHEGTFLIEDAAPVPGRRFVVTLPASGRPPRTDDEAR
ncbi:MAG: hybrid sensor histidine kinase/response regulator [Deltaproteobacteria bacterium]|nr:hybrid sensor histidine kinase/response regulator [Deltaproteobacteria bacterium]